ncbi:MAG TPA: PQQ-dependent sugar dehydrogenase [Humisphaera sp.]
MPYPAPRRPLAEPLERRTLFAAADGFVQSTFVDGLDRPTAMAFAPDGRLFVAEQGGALRVVAAGAVLPDPFVSLDVDDAGERGLIGVALDPAFAANGFVYVHYTVPGEGAVAPHNRVSRFTAAGDAAAPGSEAVLLDLPALSAATNHNGGAIHFGPDGKLYVGVGENNDASLAQPLDTPFGKLLRVNPDGSVPADNPFVGQTTGTARAIFARGLRNPYTFAFDPATGRLHVNDVGQSTFEEVDVGRAGANYGWPVIEGKRTTQDPPDGYADPLLAYGRTGGKIVGNAIAGGTFYRAPDAATDPLPAAFDGDYLFGDFGTGFVKSMDVGTR